MQVKCFNYKKKFIKLTNDKIKKKQIEKFTGYNDLTDILRINPLSCNPEKKNQSYSSDRTQDLSITNTNNYQ